MPQPSTEQFLRDVLQCSSEEITAFGKHPESGDPDSVIETLKLLQESNVSIKIIKAFLYYARATKTNFDAYLANYTPQQQRIILGDLKIFLSEIFAKTKRQEFPVYYAADGYSGAYQAEHLRQKFNLKLDGTLEIPDVVILSLNHMTLQNMAFFSLQVAEKGQADAIVTTRDAALWIIEIARALAILLKRHVIDVGDNAQASSNVFAVLPRYKYQTHLSTIFADVPPSQDFLLRMANYFTGNVTTVTLLWAKHDGSGQVVNFKEFAKYAAGKKPYGEYRHYDHEGPIGDGRFAQRFSFRREFGAERGWQPGDGVELRAGCEHYRDTLQLQLNQAFSNDPASLAACAWMSGWPTATPTSSPIGSPILTGTKLIADEQSKAGNAYKLDNDADESDIECKNQLSPYIGDAPRIVTKFELV